MWKKDETPSSPPATPKKEESPAPSRPTPPPPSREQRATIGRSITIRGEVRGNEDLLIQGEIDGSVELEKQAVTVGEEGKVTANITGRVVTVEGFVEGDLKAEERVILTSSAQVEGDITAPRVVLEDGANFRGGIDMGVQGKESGKADASSSQESGRDSGPTKSRGTSGASGNESPSSSDTKGGAEEKSGKAKV
jgi:cytoskeletal protein CcmA (bactofilin family)